MWLAFCFETLNILKLSNNWHITHAVYVEDRETFT